MQNMCHCIDLCIFCIFSAYFVFIFVHIFAYILHILHFEVYAMAHINNFMHFFFLHRTTYLLHILCIFIMMHIKCILFAYNCMFC